MAIKQADRVDVQERFAEEEVDFASLPGGPWDGRMYSYIPRREIPVHPSLPIHDEYDLEVDPITYQVLRSRFWHINLEHSDTIKKASGSPVIVWADDFNTALLTETGDTVVSGPAIQYFTGLADLVVKWTIENRSESPGIEDGDIFLQNDPFIGAPHQPDTSTYSPLFWDGKLFCWIYSCCHVGDIGGVDPGSFCVRASDIYEDPLTLPPIKLARRGVLQDDVAGMFVRHSRVPDMMELQLRSQSAGIYATRQRFKEVLDRYGPAVVKGAMRRMIADCSTAVSNRLQQVPDGVFREAVYVGSAGPDDRSLHREVMTLRKEGDKIICSNEGSDDQSLAGNSTYSSWRSALISAASALFAWDQLYCPAGVAQHLKFEPIPGTRNVAAWPAAISALTSTLISVNLAYHTMSKMLSAAPEALREGMNSAGGLSLPGWWIAFGTDRHGKFVADATGDSLFGAIGAFSSRDGVDTGGAWWFPRTIAGNAEEWESSLPILYLYRREKADSGGPGRWRGGNGAEIALTGHKTSQLNAQIVSADPAANASLGLEGGYPGHSGNHRYLQGTQIRDVFGAGRMPYRLEDIEDELGSLSRIAPKANVSLLPGDVLVVGYSAGGGVGDPLTREPEKVQADVLAGTVTRESAELHWGVIMDHESLDVEKTESLRASITERRLEEGSVRDSNSSNGGDVSSGELVRAASFSIALAQEGNTNKVVCSRCRRVLSDIHQNYKVGVSIREKRPDDVDPEKYPNPELFCDEAIVLREYICPSCGLLLSVEMCRPEDEPLWDIELT